MQRPRPVSPHLTTWRWRIWAIASITHRISAVGLYLLGMPMLAWFLISVALGPGAYAVFIAFAGSWFGRLVLVGLTWALFQHMASGTRHLFMDTGRGFGLATSRRSGAATFIVSVAITALCWGYVWLS